MNLSTETFELTIEQNFQLEAISRQVQSSQSIDEMRSMLVTMARLIMVKDNVIRHLAKIN